MDITLEKKEDSFNIFTLKEGGVQSTNPIYTK